MGIKINRHINQILFFLYIWSHEDTFLMTNQDKCLLRYRGVWCQQLFRLKELFERILAVLTKSNS